MENRYKYLDGQGEHVHLLDDQPLIGTSRVGSILAKQGLTWYAAAKAVEVFGCPNAKMLTKIKNGKADAIEKQAHYDALRYFFRKLLKMSDEEFFKLIDTAYRAHDVYFRSRAPIGKDLHTECEKFVRCHMEGISERVSPLVWPAEIRPFVNWAASDVKRFLWSEGHVFSEKMWTGGISDCGYEKKDGTVGVLDFKSSKEAYLEQFAQCAGYDIQATENNVVDANGNLVYKLEKPITEYCIFPFGAEKPEPQFHVNVDGLKKMFRAELYIYNMLPKD